MTDTEILKKLKAIIKERAHEHLFEFERDDWHFGYKAALKELLKDLEKLEETK